MVTNLLSLVTWEHYKSIYMIFAIKIYWMPAVVISVNYPSFKSHSFCKIFTLWLFYSLNCSAHPRIGLLQDFCPSKLIYNVTLKQGEALVDCYFNKWHVSYFTAMVIPLTREISREQAFEVLIILRIWLNIPDHIYLLCK